MQASILPLDGGTGGPVADLLADIRRKLGRVPNMVSTLAHSPAVLNAYVAFSASLNKAGLQPDVREQIALAVAGVNGCDYCASAHTALASAAGVAADEARVNLHGKAADPQTEALLQLALDIVRQQGHVPADRLSALRAQGFTDRDFVEVMGVVALNMFTNYFNHLAQTEIDFPLVNSRPVLDTDAVS